jgi:hypothetical protein
VLADAWKPTDVALLVNTVTCCAGAPFADETNSKPAGLGFGDAGMVD